MEYHYAYGVKIVTSVMKKMALRWPGIEPGSTAWKAAMLTTIPPTLDVLQCCNLTLYTTH